MTHVPEAATVAPQAAPAPAAGAAHTSALALDAMGLRTLARSNRAIFDICVGAQRNGACDLSLREIQQRYERLYSKRIDVSSVSARVHSLIEAGWLHRRADPRVCSITGRSVLPVFAPEKQARLCP